MRIVLQTLILLTTITMNAQLLIYDFTQNNKSDDWYIVDDRVMGGVSQGLMSVNQAGFGVFQGVVSTANYGGFSSVRHAFKPISVSNYKTIVVKLKGDGKPYQCRIKPSANTYYSYIYTFETSGDWQTIEIPLREMFPSFRGRKLDLPNFDQDVIAEIAFLIGNKKNESFQLLIELIHLK